MFTHARTVWQSVSQPVKGPAIDWSRIDTVVIHYTGTPDSPEGDDRSRYAQFLRNMQASYVNGRGYSLGYSVAVSTVGESWEIRGVDLKAAATKGHNDHSWAVLVTVDGDNEASPAAVVEVRRLVAAATARAGRPLTVAGHGQLGATSCPGSGLRRQIAAGVFQPATPDPPEDDMSTSVLVRIKGYWNVWLIGVGPALHMTPELYDHYQRAGVADLVVADHPQLRKSLFLQSGMTDADLVPSGGV